MALMQEDIDRGINNVELEVLLEALFPKFPTVLEKAKNVQREMGGFIANDLTIYAALKKAGMRKTSPDCIIVKVKTFVEHLQDTEVSEDESFDTLRLTAANKPKGTPLAWSNVLASLEFKYGRKIGNFNLGEPAINSRSPAGGSKRGSEGPSPDAPPQKRSKTDSTSTSREKVKELLNLTLSPEQQGGFYALERLRCGPFISHTITLLLQDRSLSLQFYDAQGRIASKSIDFIHRFDLLIALVSVLDEFDDQAWGHITLPSELASRTLDTNSEWVDRPFAIRGRRTFACPILKSPEEFFKSSWSEDRRTDKEYKIVAEARERAGKYLPADIIGFVTNHLPSCIIAGTMELTSTKCIPLWMVSKRLSPFRYQDYLDDPEMLWRLIWKAIRCHNLLWRIGVAHGDISLTNLMVAKQIVPHGGTVAAEQDADSDPWIVLSDYDLSALMEAGGESPAAGVRKNRNPPFHLYGSAHPTAWNYPAQIWARP
ncbi:hypothetical protein R3P38DRAFT_2787464 [Favolaschia claudopus]|uniref:Fungal-type protein kinase domain-containing protein n=1 Tax=Favolaschia claudopus TaxID=2862362 RepID=A0AAW0AN30_9AGAR